MYERMTRMMDQTVKLSCIFIDVLIGGAFIAAGLFIHYDKPLFVTWMGVGIAGYGTFHIIVTIVRLIMRQRAK